jgi:tetratricopeptide (TPR) repeat protein
MRLQRLGWYMAGILLFAGFVLAADGPARLTTDEAAAKLERAQYVFTAGRFAEAESVARDIALAADDPAALSGAVDVIALCRLSEGDFDGATKALEDLKASIANPTVQAYLDKRAADIQAKRSAHDQAIAALEAIVAAHPGDETGADAAYRIGETETFWARYPQALTAFGRVVSEFSSSNRALLARLAMGDLQERAGRHTEADTLYAEVVKRAPNTLCAAQAVARTKAALVARGDAATAIRRMNEIVNAHPKTEAAARAQFCLGEIHAVAGETIEAEAAFVAAARECPTSLVVREAKDELAQMYYSLVAATPGEQDLTAALESWRKAAHVDPDPVRRVETLYRIAVVCLQLAKYDDARAAAEEILKDNSPPYAKWHDATRALVARTYYREGKYAEALTRFEALLANCQDAQDKKALQIMVDEIKRCIEQQRQEATPAK